MDYARRVINGKQLLFTVTTDATLMTPDIAEYLLENEFSVLVSIDGPQDIHDRYRRDRAGKGSFDDTLKGLEILSRRYQRIERGSISINAVYAPPFSSQKLERINRFFKELEWLPEISILTNYPTEGSVPGFMETSWNIDEDQDSNRWAFRGYYHASSEPDSMVRNLIEPLLAKLLQRSVFKKPVELFKLNGCCLPGQRKAYITTEGNIHVCEKINNTAPTVGNVDTGFDIETIQKFYIDEYVEKSMQECSNCWALRLCDVFYISALSNCGNLDIGIKSQYCHSVRQSMGNTLVDFVTCMEEKPGGLDYLYDYDIE